MSEQEIAAKNAALAENAPFKPGDVVVWVYERKTKKVIKEIDSHHRAICEYWDGAHFRMEVHDLSELLAYFSVGDWVSWVYEPDISMRVLEVLDDEFPSRDQAGFMVRCSSDTRGPSSIIHSTSLRKTEGLPILGDVVVGLKEDGVEVRMTVIAIRDIQHGKDIAGPVERRMICEWTDEEGNHRRTFAWHEVQKVATKNCSLNGYHEEEEVTSELQGSHF